MLQVTSQSVVRRGLLGMGAAVMIAFAGAALTHASSLLNHPNIIRFPKEVALPGHVLPAGVYVFEIANPEASHDVVRVIDRETRKPIYVGFTRRVQRPAAMSPDQAVTFNEAVVGTPTPLRAWYPIGLSDGHEFIYK
jgi:hypothetical protein